MLENCTELGEEVDGRAVRAKVETRGLDHGRRLETVGGAQHSGQGRAGTLEVLPGGANRVEGRNAVAEQAQRFGLDSLGVGDSPAAQPSLDEVRARACEPGVGRAQEGEQLTAPTAEPGETQQPDERPAERRTSQSDPPLERVRDPQLGEGGLERYPRALERGGDDRNLLGGRPAPNQREDLVADEFQRRPGSRRLEKAHRPFERRGLPPAVLKQRSLEMRQRRRFVPALRGELLDPVCKRGQVVGDAAQRGEGGPRGLVGQRHGHVGAPRERLEQPPLRAGEILESVRKDGGPAPRVEGARDALDRAPLGGRAVADTEPVELGAVGTVERSQVAAHIVGVDERGLELHDRVSECLGETAESRRASDAVERCLTRDACEHQPAGRIADHRSWIGIGAENPAEQVVERPDLAAEERGRPAQQLSLDGVDISSRRNDEKRLTVDRFQIAIEEPRDLAGVRRTHEQCQRHPGDSSSPPGHDPAAGRRTPARLDLGLGLAAAPGGGGAGHLRRAAVAEVCGLGAAAGVGVGDAHPRPATFFDFGAAIVADQYRLSSQWISSP